MTRYLVVFPHAQMPCIGGQGSGWASLFADRGSPLLVPGRNRVMATTVEAGFRMFHTRLTPSATETVAAKRHRRSIQACLRTNFGLIRFFRTGSFGNGTSIRDCSDVDYFAHVPTNRLKQNSETALSEFRNALDTRFPNTGVRVSSPAVLVPFGDNRSEWTEIVPVGRIRGRGRPVYDIPDGDAGWTRSSPDAHNSYVRVVDRRRAGKVRPLVRFLKAWKYARNVPISSFYLELQVARYSYGKNTIIYAHDVWGVLGHLQATGLASMQDPVGISGLILACKTAAQKEDALSKLATAVTRADKALAAAQVRRIRDAFGWWDLVFGNAFPSYG